MKLKLKIWYTYFSCLKIVDHYFVVLVEAAVSSWCTEFLCFIIFPKHVQARCRNRWLIRRSFQK